ncbi:FecR domain-containing protein [Paraburkholderia sp.]|uniref:FecR family protein n=1 Tax=Paraburkholderia sp. TaxID=1926495 RepID=UPI002396C4D4|nr:FecR domain-containing protein [Paraburkholderia sp.]MDE1179371.1 FecR domain-containing protein [Paraburkholderia sp.]
MERSTPHSELPPTRARAHADADATPSGAAPSIDAAVESQAATWFVRRQTDVGASDEAAFQAWLAQSPAHRQCYALFANVWQTLDDVPKRDIDRFKTGFARVEPVAKPAARTAPASPGRRAFVPRFALAGTAFACVGAGWLGWNAWQQSPTFTASYETRRGEFQKIALPDGSTMELDTDTRVETRLFRHRRDVHVIRGQAMFTVKADPDCPFNVMARAVTVTVVGTRFVVRCTDSGLENGNVRVDVQEGRVRVASTPPGSDTRRVIELAAGQFVTTDAVGLLGPVSAISPAEVGAWRQGRVTFDDTTLSRALQEFERYEATHIVVADPSVGAMRLTGSFDVRQLGLFVRALPRVLPVRLRPRGDVIEIVRTV